MAWHAGLRVTRQRGAVVPQPRPTRITYHLHSVPGIQPASIRPMYAQAVVPQGFRSREPRAGMRNSLLSGVATPSPRQWGAPLLLSIHWLRTRLLLATTLPVHRQCQYLRSSNAQEIPHVSMQRMFVTNAAKVDFLRRELPAGIPCIPSSVAATK